MNSQQSEDRNPDSHPEPDSIVNWTEELDQAIDERFDDLVSLRRHIHMHPEPSGAEQETSAFLAAHLRERGLGVEFGPENRGLIVEPNGMDRSELQRCIAIRADLDALRIHEAKTTVYRSQVPSVMHACGHDGHAAVVVGTLVALQRLQDEGTLPWPLRVRGIFQPAEETSRGAREMITSGALRDVNAILSMHLDPSRAVGAIGVREGAFTAACDELEIRIEGRGGHAARPHESLDPIAAAAQLISSIYLFVPRAIDSHDAVVVTIGQISGGDNPNVIPEEVLLRGTVRTLSGAIREQTKEHIRQIARGMAETSGVAMRVGYADSAGSVHNDPSLTALIREAAGSVVAIDNVQEIERPSMGGEDFAEYLDLVPGCMFRLGCRSSAFPGAPLHSPNFDIDERAIAIGAKILGRAVVLWSHPKRLGPLKDETGT